MVLYKDFYIRSDKLNFEIAKVSGHSRTSEKNRIEYIFSFIDKFSRASLRKYLMNNK
jgi:hypothetical protein